MWTDPIVEAGRVREEYAARFDYDLNAIARHLREQEKQLKEEGWQVVSTPPKRPKASGRAQHDLRLRAPYRSADSRRRLNP